MPEPATSIDLASRPQQSNDESRRRSISRALLRPAVEVVSEEEQNGVEFWSRVEVYTLYIQIAITFIIFLLVCGISYIEHKPLFARHFVVGGRTWAPTAVISQVLSAAFAIPPPDRSETEAIITIIILLHQLAT
jgi:hypothetical protein